MHSSENETASQAKRRRNIRTLAVAKSLMGSSFSGDPAIRIICECEDLMCRELITLPGSTFDKASKTDKYFILPGHVLAGSDMPKA